MINWSDLDKFLFINERKPRFIQIVNVRNGYGYGFCMV